MTKKGLQVHRILKVLLLVFIVIHLVAYMLFISTKDNRLGLEHVEN